MAITVIKGGKGSGNHGHVGRPGHVGGSSGGGKIAFQPGLVPAVPVTATGYSLEELDAMSKRMYGMSYTPEHGDSYIRSLRNRIDEMREKQLRQPDPDLQKAFDDELLAVNPDINPNALQFGAGVEQARGLIKDKIVKSISEETGVDYDTVNDIIGQWAQSSNDTDIRSLSLQEAAAEELGVELSGWQKDHLAEVRARADEAVQFVINEYTGGVPEIGTIRMYLTVTGEPQPTNPSPEELRDLAHKAMSYWNLSTDPITDRATERKVIRAMYSQTQRRLKAAGIGGKDGYVTLFRGITFTENDPRGRMKRGTVVNYHGNSMESWSYDFSIANSFGRATLSMRVPVTSIISTALTGFGCYSEGEVVITGVAGSRAVVVAQGYI